MFETFPYLLPCVISSCLSASGYIFGYFYLKETLQSKIVADLDTLVVVKVKQPKLPEEGRSYFMMLICNTQYLLAMLIVGNCVVVG